MSYRYLSIIIFFILANCMTLKDYSENPLSIREDQMKGIKFISSNWIDNYSNTNLTKLNGYIKPYFGEKDNKIWFRVKTLAKTDSGALHYRKLSIRCGKKDPVHIQQKPFENWSKDFDSSCFSYGCTSYEYADVKPAKPNINYILSCKNYLTVRLTGSANYTEFTYTQKKHPNIYKGLDDLNKYLSESISKRGVEIH